MVAEIRPPIERDRHGACREDHSELVAEAALVALAREVERAFPTDEPPPELFGGKGSA